MLFLQKDFSRLVKESEDAKSHAKSISGVSPVVESSSETEIRFHAYAPRTTWDYGAHERVKQFFSRKVSPSLFERSLTSVHMYSDNIRRIVDESDQEEHFERKLELYKWFNDAYALKAAVSREDIMSPGFRPSSKVSFVRKRDRVRIPYSNAFVDLTVVTVKGKSHEQIQFEVELEIPNISAFSFDSLHQLVRMLFRVLRGTENPYTVSMYGLMAEFYNGTMSQETYVKKGVGADDFDTRFQSRARTLKLKDVTYGGIVSEKIHYSATPKADGTRTALMIQDKTGVWLYSGNGNLNWLSASSDLYADLHGTILDVESISQENRTAADAKLYQYFLVVFDTLATTSNFVRGDTSIQNKDHGERMMTAEAVLARLGERIMAKSPKLALLVTKTFYYSINVDQFFDSVIKARHLITSGVLPYKTDGIIFTPSNLKPIPHPGLFKIPPAKRYLQDYPDIVKFKPANLLTIDFAVDTNDRQLFSYGRGESVPFTARGFNSVENVAWAECEEKSFPRGAIVEFEWRDHQFHPIRHRPDRDKPNSLDIARDNFQLLVDPLSYDTIAGIDNQLFIQYHRNVKSLLYTTASHARSRLLPKKDPETYTLLDLGSGQGGDLHRWAKAGFTHVIAVEPSQSNIIEMKKRIDSIISQGQQASKYPRIDVFNNSAEDSDEILTCSEKKLGGNPKAIDVISAMLSASFFWKDDATLNGVVKTIKNHSHKGTLFLMFTINGQLIEEMISPSLREGVVLESPVNLAGITFDFPIDQWQQVAGRPIGGLQGMLPPATGRSYKVTFKDTRTVRSMEGPADSAQLEYMVYPQMLTDLLKPEFILKSHEIANKEALLPGPWRIATSLYSYAIYERIKD